MPTKKRFYYTFLFFFFAVLTNGQELPPIVKYNPNNYTAGNQNWMISQDKNQFLYFANNDGLLEFNGSNWKLYKSPNETILRSVKVIDHKIYTGCYMEFGYWIRQNNGLLQYSSLSKKIKNKILDDEQFWNILNYDQWVIFQSLSRIYIYDTKKQSFTIIAPKNNILKSYRTANAIYFQTVQDGLFEIENGKSKLVSNHPVVQKNKIVNIVATEDGLLLQTQFNGFYKLNNGSISTFSIDSQLNNNSVYCTQSLSDGGFAIGTISNGVFIISKEGITKYHITQNTGLSNNTALSLFEDVDKNLWIGLDNGINCINLQSPVKSYVDNTGMLGTVYTSILHENKLYIGTNQGLFYKNFNSNEDFQFIAGTKGQVWSLDKIDGTLFCGHDSGTFIITNGIAQSVFSSSGTWKVEKVPNTNHLLLQGNYYGLSILEKINNRWVFRNKIQNFDYSAKYFSVLPNKEVYISHEYKGVFRINLDTNLQKATRVYTYTSPEKGKNSSLITYHNNVYYAYKKGIFKLNPKTKKFEKDAILSSVFEKDAYTSGKLIADSSNKIWLFSKNYIHYFSLSKLSSDLKQNAIPIPASLTNSMSGYENITQLSNTLYLIGTTDGYYTININDLSFRKIK